MKNGLIKQPKTITINAFKMDFAHIAEKIIRLKNADLKLRDELIKKGQLFNDYNKKMEALHICNAEALNAIINQIGYPTANKVGKEASDAGWLIIQHAISRPVFMKKCAQLLATAVNEKKADPVNLAYLLDRIAVFEDKPQLYGTQFDWDKHGELSPNAIDDVTKVNNRRNSIGLNSLEEQIQLMRKTAQKENEVPVSNHYQRLKKYNEWRKKVGWIK